MSDTKTCNACGETKPLEGGFYCTLRRNGRRYWRSQCNQCENRSRNRSVLNPIAKVPLPTREELAAWYAAGCRIA